MVTKQHLGTYALQKQQWEILTAPPAECGQI
jgi:hypothetical protein